MFAHKLSVFFVDTNASKPVPLTVSVAVSVESVALLSFKYGLAGQRGSRNTTIFGVFGNQRVLHVVSQARIACAATPM